jgi:hypothetical protein
VLGPGFGERVEQALPGRVPWRGPEAGDERGRMIGQTAAERGQRQQSGLVGPLQVVEADHQGPVNCQFLG